MTLTIRSTGQAAEIEEVAEGGYYCRVRGHIRFLPTEAVIHPAPRCPQCGGQLAEDYDPAFRASYRACQTPTCFFEYRLA